MATKKGQADMKLHVINLPAFRAALACVAKAGFQGVLQGVHFEPSGTVAGTDGFRLAWHPHGVAPFDGEPLTVKIDKAPPAGARDVVIDTEAGVISWTTKRGQPGVGACSLLAASYPDFRRVTPAHGSQGKRVFGVNAEYLAEIVKAVNLDRPVSTAERGRAFWQFADHGGLVLLDEDAELNVLVMSLRNEPEERLPVSPLPYAK